MMSLNLISAEKSSFYEEINFECRPQVPDTVLQYDTIYTYEIIYDTIFYYDTIYIEEYEKMPAKFAHDIELNPFNYFSNTNFLNRDKDSTNLFSDRKWSFEIFTSGFGGSYSYNTKDINKNKLADIRDSSFSPKLGYNGGLNINFHINKNLMIQSGLAFSWYNENLNFYSKGSIMDTISDFTIQDSEIPQVDTIYFLNVDALVMGDSVFIQHYDTVMIPTTDTIPFSRYELKDTISQREGVYRMQYFEVPLIASYNFDWEMISISSKAGLITGFLYGYNRYEIYTDNSIFKSGIQEKKELKSINLSAYFSLSFEYQLDRHWSILGEPWLRIPITDFSESEGVVLKMRAQGIRVGIRYYL